MLPIQLVVAVRLRPIDQMIYSNCENNIYKHNPTLLRHFILGAGGPRRQIKVTPTVLNTVISAALSPREYA